MYATMHANCRGRAKVEQRQSVSRPGRSGWRQWPVQCRCRRPAAPILYNGIGRTLTVAVSSGHYHQHDGRTFVLVRLRSAGARSTSFDKNVNLEMRLRWDENMKLLWSSGTLDPLMVSSSGQTHIYLIDVKSFRKK